MKKFVQLFTLLSALFLSNSIAHTYQPIVEKAVIKTSKGDIEIALFTDKAPKSVENFVKYAQSGFYNDTVFHRVISGFMVQGGGLTADLQRKKTEEPIDNEADNGIANKRGTLAMARTGAPHSATSQFFINLVDNDFLDHKSKDSGQTWGYAVFGEVTKGMDVVDTIGKVATGIQQGRRDVPVEPVQILAVEIITKSVDKKTESTTTEDTTSE